jgi:hypothetical protein
VKRFLTALAVGLTVWLMTAAAAYAGGGGGPLPQPAGALISQSNQQSSSCSAGSSNLKSCNNEAQNQNSGNASSGGGLLVTTVASPLAPPPPGGGNGGNATISQSNTQSSSCKAWYSNEGSCNNSASNQNTGNAISGGPTLKKLSPQPGPPPSVDNGTATISQSNRQSSSCHAGYENVESCNNSAQNQNTGDAIAGASDRLVRTTSLPGPGGQGGSAVIRQSNDQSSRCKAWGSNEGSCNNSASNQNTGNAESGGGAIYAPPGAKPSGPVKPQGGGGALISQSNQQLSSCHAWAYNKDSCNNTAQNQNTGNAESSGGGPDYGLKQGYDKPKPAAGGATIHQSNTQSSDCKAWANEGSCNNSAQNQNTGNAESYGGAPSGKPGYDSKPKQGYDEKKDCGEPKKDGYDKKPDSYGKDKGDCHPKPPCDEHKKPPHDNKPPAPPKEQPTGIQQSNTQQSSCWTKGINLESCNNTAQNANTGNVLVSEGGQSASWSGAGIQQSNQQSSSCGAGYANVGSCNNTAQNVNSGNVIVGDPKS